MKKETKNPNEKKKYSFSYLLDIITDSFVVAIKKVNKFLADKKKNVIVRIIIRIVCCLLILAILKAPFFALGKVGEGIIYLLGTTFREVFASIWISVVSYAYWLFSLIIFFKVIYDMSNRKDYKIEIKQSIQIGNNLYYAIKVILKIMITISLIPLMLVAIMLFALLGMLICFITHGMYIFGPFLIIIGLIVMVVASLSYISDIVLFDKGDDN